VKCRQFQHTTAIFASLFPNIRYLDPVIQRVSHHMQQRIPQVFQHRGVEFHVAAARFQPHYLAVRRGNIAHRPT
jgi:hypothetical protein